jgi:hypothetical protein
MLVAADMAVAEMPQKNADTLVAGIALTADTTADTTVDMPGAEMLQKNFQSSLLQMSICWTCPDSRSSSALKFSPA